MTDPHVWVPKAKSQKPAATEAPEPLEEPPGVYFKFLGFLVLPGSEIANSAVTVFAINVAPEFNKLVTTLDCFPEKRSEGSSEPHLVGYPSTFMMSFTAKEIL